MDYENKLCVEIFANKVFLKINLHDTKIDLFKYFNNITEYDEINESEIENVVYITEEKNGNVIKISTNLIENDYYLKTENKNLKQIELELFDYLNQLIRIALKKDFYFLHASMVEKNHEGFIIIGKTHSGKSTIAINLLGYGYNYVTDDIVGINKKSGEVIGINKPIYIRNSNLVFTEKSEIKTIKINDNMSYYMYKSNYSKPLVLNSNLILISRINQTNDNSYKIKMLDGSDKILQILENTFNEDINKNIISDFTRLFKNKKIIKIEYYDNINIAKVIFDEGLFDL